MKSISYLEETYSRKAVVAQAGKQFQAQLEKVKDRFPTSDDIMEYFEKLDETSQKKLVPVFVLWFKQTKQVDVFFDLLEEYAPALSQALEKKIPILNQNYGVINPFSITEPDDFLIYMVQVKSDLDDLLAKKEEEERIKKKIKDALVHKDEKKTVYLSKDEDTNICLGKGTKWCISGTKDNTTGLYQEMKSSSFYLISTNIKKKIEKEGKEWEGWVKYAYVPIHPWPAAVVNANFLFDFRDDANMIPELDAPYAEEIFVEMNDKVGKNESEFNFRDFVNMLRANHFFPFPKPENWGGGYIDVPDEEMYLSMFYFPLYAFGGGFKNKPFYNNVQRILSRADTPERRRGSENYIQWDTKYFHQQVYVPSFKSAFVPAMNEMLSSTWKRSSKKGGDFIIMFHVIQSLLEKGASEQDVSFWKRIFNMLYYNDINKIDLMKKEGGHLYCLSKDNNVILSTKDLL